MSEGALEQHPIDADPALYNRIGFRDGGFGIARICARPTNRRFLAPLRGRHLARSATIVGSRTRRISGKGPNYYRRPVARTKPSVRIAGMDLPATAIREGNFERVDLTLLSIDEQKLPIYLQMRRMPLCDNEPWPGEPVIVAIPEDTARSHIMLPSLLPAQYQKRFSTVIRDVATTGNSGSGVFDAGQKCLLGIISLKIYQTPSNKAPESEHRDIAKYFVPASIIRAFIPPEYRF
jgi:hypothetical protein